MTKKQLADGKPASPALPEPIALTPEQAKQVAAGTVGGLSLVATSLRIWAGGLPAGPLASVAQFAALE